MRRSSLAALLAVFAVPCSLLAQAVQPMGAIHPNAQPLSTVARISVPPLDRQAIEAQDQQRALQGLAPRYAIPNTVSVDASTQGTWEILDDSWSLWRLLVSAPGASHVNLGFTRFKLPPTGRLMVSSADYQNVLRPFDASDHSPSGQLWTPVVNGDLMVVEVYVQTAQRPQVELTLGQVGSGYRFFGAGAHAVTDGGSGACNVDVQCPQGAAWVQEIPSVAAISSGGSIFCTGFMVNNTAQDGTPYFMTARHCGVQSNAASLVCYWNYQRAVCGSGSGSLSQFSTGSQLRATYNASDFTLVELNAQPNAAWGVTYAGWTHSSANASSAVCIHHPSGDDKKISFENQPVTTTSYLGTSQPGNGTHVRVTDWDVGTTEPGSSGSPLFDQNHRIIGQLHGGSAACGNNLSDWFGRFSVSWTGGGSNSSRLSNWLDPLGTGQMTLDTMGSNAASASSYGTGCYTSYATFYEMFSGSFDLSGTNSTTVSLVMTPTSNGYSVAYGGNVWSTPTTSDLGLGDDAVTSTITLPFTFAYPGGSTNQVRMCSNGYVWLGNQSGADWSPSVSEFVGQAPRLVPCWTDLNPSAGGTTHYHVEPGNQAVYFTWSNVPPYGSSSPTNTLQAVLRSNGVIEYRYRSVSNFGSGGTAITGWSPGNGVAVPPMSDISASLPLSVSVDANGLSFAATSRPVQGTTMTADISNIPAGAGFAGVFLGFTSYPSGLSLANLGMPGCQQYCSQEFAWSLVASTSTATFSLAIPTGSMWSGVHMYAQAASLAPGANTLGALASNGLDLLFNPN